MRRIINGKRFDTEAPGTKCVGSRMAKCGRSDFHFWDESLYRTKRGRWFLVGEGNALSHWAEVTLEGTVRGTGIRPLTPRQALEWLEQGKLHTEIKAHFADDVEDA